MGPGPRRSCALLAALVASWATVAAAAPPTGRTLSEDPRIEHRAGLLSVSDVKLIRRLAKELGFDAVRDATGDVNGGEEFVYLNRSLEVEFSASLAAHPGWQASRRFELAAAEWAGLPLGSAVAVAARWEPWVPGSWLNRSGGLHLDARFRPWRRSTVLAYLSGNHAGMGVSGADTENGLTVFPCIETDDMDASEFSRRQRLCSRAQRHLQLAHEKLLKVHAEGLQLPPSRQLAFLEEHPELATLPRLSADGSRPANWLWTAAHDAVADLPGALHADPLAALAEAMCRGQAPGLRIAPTPGAALLLETASPGTTGQLVPDWRLWHAGCSPLRGHGRRWTVQLFLEGPEPLCKGRPLAGKGVPAKCTRTQRT
mmetsp:Transcript_69989/g.193590  ORF Transcript_69989/g.193590 Transcript_69989/m.193590 type:complete len:371 (+) Transcript_69989:56-1168(+)